VEVCRLTLVMRMSNLRRNLGRPAQETSAFLVILAALLISESTPARFSQAYCNGSFDRGHYEIVVCDTTRERAGRDLPLVIP